MSGLPSPGAIGQAESFTVQALPGGHRHFAIKVRLQKGTWSEISDSVCAFVSDERNSLRDASYGAVISFTGVASGTGAGNTFYCQRSDRYQAVKVIPKLPQAPAVGQRVTVTGALTQDANLRGPVLDKAVVAPGNGAETVRPLGMRLLALGGFDARYGGTGDEGTSNLWMRVRVSGQVSQLTTASGCSFNLNDGSRLTDNAGNGVVVTSPFAAPAGLSDGDFVTVEGICRLHRTDGRQVEVVESTAITVW